MKYVKKMISLILDLPITLYFNFYYLSFKDAIKMPFRVSHKIEVKSMGKKKSISIDNPKFTKISIGKNGSFALGKAERLYWDVRNSSRIQFKGNASFGRGSQIICGENSSICFGKDFYSNADCIINSDGVLEFGNNVIIGWKSEIITGSGHKINSITNTEKKENERKVVIGNNVWVASNVSILNGAYISDDSVVAAKSLVSKRFEEKNIIIGKFNEVLKKGIVWEK